MKKILLIFITYILFNSACAYGIETGEKAGLAFKNAVKLYQESNYSACYRIITGIIKQSGANRKLIADSYLLMAYCDLERNLYGSALKNAGSAMRNFDLLKEKENSFLSGLVIISALNLRGGKQEASQRLRVAEKMVPTLESSKCRIKFYILRGAMLLEREDYDLAGRNFDEAARLAKAIDDKRSLIVSKCYLALISSKLKDFKKAANICSNAMEFAGNIDCPYLVAFLLENAGDIYLESADSPLALISYQGAYEIYRKIENYGKAGNILFKISGFYSSGDLKKSKEYAKKALSLFSQTGCDPFDKMKILFNQITFLIISGEFKSIASILEELHKVADKSAEKYLKAQVYEKEGRIYLEQSGNMNSAVKAFNEAKRIYESINDKSGELRCLVSIADALSRLGKLDDAMNEFKKCLAIAESIGEIYEFDDQHFFRECSPGGIYRKMGKVCISSNQYSKAKEYYEKALSYDKPDDLICYRVQDRSGLITVSIAVYDTELAKVEITTAFNEIRQIKSAKDRALLYNQIISAIVSSSINFGGLKGYNKLFSFRNSVTSEIIKRIYANPELLQQIINGYKDWIAYGQERKSFIDEGLANLFLGFFYFSGERDEDAIVAYKKAIAIFKDNKLRIFEGLAHFFVGQLLIEQDKKEEAKAEIEESLRFFSNAKNSENQMNILSYLGLLNREIGNYDESLICYRKSLELATQNNNVRSASAASIGLGYTFFIMKKYREAEKYYKEALKYQAKNENKKEEALTRAFLGRLYSIMDDDSEAMKYFIKAREDLHKAGGYLDERDVVLDMGKILQKEGKNDEALAVYIDTIKTLSEIRERFDPKKTMRIKIAAPTRTLFEKTIKLLIKAGRYDEALKYFEISGTYDLFGNVDLKCIDIKDEKLKSLIGHMEDLSKKMKMIQDDMDKDCDKNRRDYLNGVLASTRQEFFAVTNEIRERNPDYGQIIGVQSSELAQLQPVMPEDTLVLEYYPAEDGLYIFIISRESYSIRQVPVTREQLYGLVGDLRKWIKEDKSTSSEGYKKARSRLYSYLIKPVKDEIDKKKFLEVIPAGMLWYVPLDFLGEENGPDLIEEKAIGYLYSSNIMKLLTTKKKIDSSMLIAFGNPTGADLPLSAEEVKKIGDTYPESKVFTGNEATKNRFITEAKNAAFLHIATHSILNRDDVNNSYIQFADGKGNLSLGEIYGLILPATSLVVLSSCESALGSDNPGREFASLASAFTVAGSPSVIASIWKVSDVSTSYLFNEFYKNLRKGLGKSESLRLAKLAVKKDISTSTPFNWAGFILLGDWR